VETHENTKYVRLEAPIGDMVGTMVKIDDKFYQVVGTAGFVGIRDPEAGDYIGLEVRPLADWWAGDYGKTLAAAHDLIQIFGREVFEDALGELDS